VAYTFDVWGLNRRTVEALKAQADNQRFQIEAAYLTVTSNVVVAAITEASLRGQIDATNEMIATSTKMLGILRRQLNSDYANRADVAIQEAALAQARASLPPLRKALAQQRDLLAALAGTFPNEGPLHSFRLADLHLPTELPVSLPSQLIEQRPDVRAAEEQLHAASAQIGVAIANLLPNFTINGNIGYMNTTLTGLLAPENLFWMAAANATQTVLDGGSLFHQMQESKDLYNAAAWSYRHSHRCGAERLRCAARVTERRRCAQSRARFRTCRQNQLRPALQARSWSVWCRNNASSRPSRRVSGTRTSSDQPSGHNKCRARPERRHAVMQQQRSGRSRLG
jgi:NodT family efflux transporter outer membrane factor (OMF) lipoprotein